jgi:transposase-like protein
MCPDCGSTNIKVGIITKVGNQSYICRECSRCFTPNGRHATRRALPKNYTKKVRSQSKSYYDRNRDRLLQEKKELRNKINKNELKNKDLVRRYGIDLDTFNNMTRSQGGVCAICGMPNKSKALYVDHDHITNKIRELLCNRCNRILGMAEEDLLLFEKMIQYLIKHGKGGQSSEHPVSKDFGNGSRHTNLPLTTTEGLYVAGRDHGGAMREVCS